ncbi:uncharacterized protein LOC122512264 [Leptopilina heterotoma]|uniref:uncharacterized protein LOC122512264 n=1 Tax=Leptopilina heterotoma TaxID=63436 RepID=UPI001CA8117D|nr:uncharacterized protein LOC122512264 [Leptopilina heterotoma]
MEEQKNTSSTPSAHPDEATRELEPKLGRGQRGNRPQIRFTPSLYDAPRPTAKLDTPVTTREDDTKRREKNILKSKRPANADSDEETAAASLFLKKVKQGNKQVTDSNDHACHDAAFGDIADKEKSVRDLLTKAVVTSSETQTEEHGDPYLELEQLRKDNLRLTRIVMDQKEEIDALKKSRTSEVNNLQPLPYVGPSLVEIRRIIDEAIAPIQRDIRIIRNNSDNPTNAALEACGRADSVVSCAGVNISNDVLQKVIGCDKLSSRVTCLLRGYWTKEQLAIAYYQKPKTVTGNYVQVTDNDIDKIRNIILELQMTERTKLKVEESVLTLSKIKSHILQSLKNERRYYNDSLQDDNSSASTVD